MTSMCGTGMVEFRFFRPDVAAVHVAGDFNSWQPDALPMRSVGDGWWHAQVALNGGEYRFRYLADGNWFTDFASNGVEKDVDGWNSVLVIPRPRVRRLASA